MWGFSTFLHPMLRKARERVALGVFREGGGSAPAVSEIDVGGVPAASRGSRGGAGALPGGPRALTSGRREPRLAQITSRDERDFAFGALFKAERGSCSGGAITAQSCCAPWLSAAASRCTTCSHTAFGGTTAEKTFSGAPRCLRKSARASFFLAQESDRRAERRSCGGLDRERKE